jgi:hypothetical protein
MPEGDNHSRMADTRRVTESDNRRSGSGPIATGLAYFTLGERSVASNRSPNVYTRETGVTFSMAQGSTSCAQIRALGRLLRGC